MNKILIITFSDPKSGTEESFGRVFNALAAAYDLKTRNQDVKLLFQGTGTRWVTEIADPKHMLHGLYKALEDNIVISGGCADAFKATDGIDEIGLPLLRDLKIDGTKGLASLGRFIEEGYSIVTY